MKAFRIRNPKIFQRVRSSSPISIGVLPQAVALPGKHRRLGALGLRRAKFASLLARVASVVEKLQRSSPLVGSISLRLLGALFFVGVFVSCGRS
jgi:hypothetical protein